MPVATSSRRRSGRNAEPEDAIEDADPTQRMERDDVEEEEPPRRNGRSVKQERQRGESSRNARQREEDPVEDEDAEGGGNPGEIAEFDPEAFGDQPLHASQSHKLQGMAMDWDTMIKNVRGSAYNLLTEVATAIADIGDDQGAEKELTQLDILTKEVLDLENEIASRGDTLKELHQLAARGQEEITNITERYEQDVTKKLSDWNQKTTRQKYARNEKYNAFKQGIWEAQHEPDVPMPPIVELIPKEDGDDSDEEDDDLYVGGVVQDLKCPLTLTWLDKPVTSEVCGHSFSAESIIQMLGNNKFTKKTCPASGCRQMICRNDLKPDKDLERKVKNAQRRAQRREEDSDAEEVIE